MCFSLKCLTVVGSFSRLMKFGHFHAPKSWSLLNLLTWFFFVKNWVMNNVHWKKKFDDTDIIVVPWPMLYWRFTENQGLLVLVQPVCVFQTYELLLQQYFWLTVKYILLNYLKTIRYIHMADKSQAFLSVWISSSMLLSKPKWLNCISPKIFHYSRF